MPADEAVGVHEHAAGDTRRLAELLVPQRAPLAKGKVGVFRWIVAAHGPAGAEPCDTQRKWDPREQLARAWGEGVSCDV